MAINFTYEASDLTVVHHTQSGNWFVFDLNEGDVISKPFTTEAKAEAERLSWLSD